jgi:redox-sensitive bicupin YhaK (pirin superfamily)
MMAPRYRDVKDDQIPVVKWHNGIEIKVISGKVGGVKGPVQDIVIDPEYIDVSIPAHGAYVHPTKPGHTVFAYVIGGMGCFCEEKKPFAYEVEGASYFDMARGVFWGNATLILFGDGHRITVSTEDEAVRFLLISGRPLGEPIAWQGPIVMNTQEELAIAFDEYRKGTFIKDGEKQ